VQPTKSSSISDIEATSSDRRHDLAELGLPGESRLEGEAVPPEYWRAFSLITFTMNRFIIDQVIRAARHFDNDTEAMILFGTIAHLNVAHLVPPGASPTSVLGTDGRVVDAQSQLRPVRIRDLAQITGRPRETIRRKVEHLEAQGRLLRLVGGFVINLAAVDPKMQALSVDAVRRFMDASRLIDAALLDAEQVLARERRSQAP
jgi:hypothetical protein